LSAVRWGVARSILIAWVLTIPAAGFTAAVAYLVLRPILGS
jgi:PiT family inorganic phosphate transporter